MYRIKKVIFRRKIGKENGKIKEKKERKTSTLVASIVWKKERQCVVQSFNNNPVKHVSISNDYFVYKFCFHVINFCYLFYHFLRKPKSSVNRPPTPDVIDREPTFQELINIKVCLDLLIWAYLLPVSYETETLTLDMTLTQICHVVSC